MRSSEIQLRKLKSRFRDKRFANHKATCTAICQQQFQSVLAHRSLAPRIHFLNYKCFWEKVRYISTLVNQGFMECHNTHYRPWRPTGYMDARALAKGRRLILGMYSSYRRLSGPQYQYGHERVSKISIPRTPGIKTGLPSACSQAKVKVFPLRPYEGQRLTWMQGSTYPQPRH